MRLRPAALAAAAALAAPAAHAEQRFETSAGPVVVSAVGPELSHPWAVAFLPGADADGPLLVTERDGRLLLIDAGESEEIDGLPRIAAFGQGGLLDIALAPDFAESGALYLSHAAPGPRRSANTVVTRARLNREAGRLEDLARIFEMTSNGSGGRHFGSRIVVAEDGTLWITTGDRGDRPSAQDPFSHNGKVHRIAPDGAIPPDNPFADGTRALPSIWSLGHRNAQGATRHPETGALWTISHGARGGDEVNRPEAGLNYGWPVISYGVHYSGGRIGEGTAKPGMEQPLFVWDPSIAPSGAAFYDGDLFPAWRGDLFTGALRDERLARLDVEGGQVLSDEPLFDGAFGRVRDVRSGPDGALWFLTDEDPGRLWRVVPAP